MTFDIRAELLLNMTNWQKGLEKANKQTQGFGKSMKTISNGVKAAWTGVGLAFTTGFMSDFVKAAVEARKADQRLDQVAKTIDLFGSKLPDVTKRLKDFADQQEISTGYSAEEIKAAQAKILTYSAVGKSAGKMGGIFDRTTQAAIDMAATGFGTVEGNADTLGKALSNPIKGLAALQKQGFVYTESQKKQFATWIKAGKLHKAQEFILRDIESQMKGVAAATADPMKQLENAIGQVTDSIGEQFLPILDKLVKYLQSDKGKNAIKSVTDQIEKMGKWFASAEGQDAFKSWIKDLKTILGYVKTILDGIKAFSEFTEQNPGVGQSLANAREKGGSNYEGGALGALGILLGIKNWSAQNQGALGAPVINLLVKNDPITGKSIVQLLNKEAQTKGVPLTMLVN
jgi:hypothetical protein